MKIKVILVGFPEVEPVVGGQEIDLEVEGITFGDLLLHLRQTYGEPMVKNLQQQILRNGKEWIKKDDLNHFLKDGDRLTFLQMMGGG